MKTRDQVLKMMRAGRLDECAAEVLRYGAIQQETRWTEDPATNGDGFQNFRACIVHHLGWEWTFEMRDGACKEFGGKPE